MVTEPRGAIGIEWVVGGLGRARRLEQNITIGLNREMVSECHCQGLKAVKRGCDKRYSSRMLSTFVEGSVS